MTVSAEIAGACRKAAVAATRGPSVHNTQPWRFVVGPRHLELYADWTRKLPVLDPTGRQLLISCGTALFNARVALAYWGVDVRVERAADPMGDGPVARLAVTDAGGDFAPIGLLEPAIELRQSNRRRFADEPIDDAVIDRIVGAAAEEEGLLIDVRRLESRMAIARLTQRADQEQNADPAYRAEIRLWTTDDGARLDGVPAAAVPRVGVTGRDEMPIRDFDARGDGQLPADTCSSIHQTLLVLSTAEDAPRAWLRAGEALEHAWLEAVRSGYTMSVFTQPIEVVWTRAMLRTELGMSHYPHLVVRLGRAPRAPGTRRRRLVDVITESTD